MVADSGRGREGWFSQAHPVSVPASPTSHGTAHGVSTHLFRRVGCAGGRSPLKSASDLSFWRSRLAHQQGYFTQRLNADGWQLEVYNSQDFEPSRCCRVEDGKPVRVEVIWPPMGQRMCGGRRWGECRSSCLTPTFPRTARDQTSPTSCTAAAPKTGFARDRVGDRWHEGVARLGLSAHGLSHERRTLCLPLVGGPAN